MIELNNAGSGGGSSFTPVLTTLGPTDITSALRRRPSTTRNTLVCCAITASEETGDYVVAQFDVYISLSAHPDAGAKLLTTSYYIFQTTAQISSSPLSFVVPPNYYYWFVAGFGATHTANWLQELVL